MSWLTQALCQLPVTLLLLSSVLAKSFCPRWVFLFFYPSLNDSCRNEVPFNVHSMEVFDFEWNIKPLLSSTFCQSQSLSCSGLNFLEASFFLHKLQSLIMASSWNNVWIALFLLINQHPAPNWKGTITSDFHSLSSSISGLTVTPSWF